MCRITTKAPYGQPVILTCKNHPELTWSTKNIGMTVDGRVYSSRTIFFNLLGTGQVECNCSASELILSPSYATLPDVDD